ncbi:hypothetical protein VCRA2120O333_20066 [Vibrio crassostreae]|nr:hypothetical protein VCRA2121O334_20067 [Vibrio crassostreae]CAK3853772.1 hypothetical protein VCRA2120O333_20066 [Vibrio crassostreae]
MAPQYKILLSYSRLWQLKCSDPHIGDDSPKYDSLRDKSALVLLL